MAACPPPPAPPSVRLTAVWTRFPPAGAPAAPRRPARPDRDRRGGPAVAKDISRRALVPAHRPEGSRSRPAHAACDALDAGRSEGVDSPRRRASWQRVRYTSTLSFRRRQVATADSIRPTNRLPPSLSVPPLIRRQSTANRNARSAALFVGSIPSTLANVHGPSSTLRICQHVADVFAQPHFDPSSGVWRTSRRSRAIRLPNVSRSGVPSRIRCQSWNSRCDCFNNRSPIGWPSPRVRSSPENRGEDEPKKSVATATRSRRKN